MHRSLSATGGASLNYAPNSSRGGAATLAATSSGLPSVPIGQTCVISMNDLQRIRSNLTQADTMLRKDLTSTSTQMMDDQHRERHELHLKSQERVKNWGNTLEALRQKKERKRQEKLDAEEARRQIQDKEEAEFRAQQRRAAIERAQKLLFEDTDRVKTFNSKLSLCDAMKERELQERIQQEKKELTKQEEAYWHQRTLEQVAEMEKEEERKREEATKRAAMAKKIQTQQLEDMKERIIQQRLDEQEEGDLIRARAVAEAEEEERQKMDARLRARQKATTTLAETRRFAQEKAELDRKQAAEEDTLIRRYSEQRDEKQRLRDARVAAIQKNKQDMRQRMIDRQFEYLMSLRTDEERRLSDQIMKAEEQRAAAEAAKEARRAQAMAEGRAFNAAQMDLKRRQQEANRQEGLVEAENLRAMFDEMKQRDLEEERQRREKNKHIKKQNSTQVSEKQRRQRQTEERRQEEAMQMQQQMQDDESEFMEYATSTIVRVQREGKNAKPLTLQLARTLKPQMISA